MNNFDPYQTPSAPKLHLLREQSRSAFTLTHRPAAPPLLGGPAPRESADLADELGCKLAPDTDRRAAGGASGERARIPWVATWFPRADWPGPLVCGRRDLGARRRSRPGSALREPRERAPSHSQACVRPTAPASGGAPDAAPSLRPQVLFPPFLPPKTGRHYGGLSCVKFFHATPSRLHPLCLSPIH